ncbi:hypothetical protein C8R46DRAFT_1096813 [Mycena filopes]|nr:hypothetical protein C8R46DRAFT_1096813 [Mycena filopes]
MLAIPQLRWILLVLWRLILLPTIHEINEMRLWIPHRFAFLAAFKPIDVAMILGPALIYAAPLWLASLLLGIHRIPRAIIRYWSLSSYSDRVILVASIVVATGAYSIVYPCLIVYAFYCALPPDLQPYFWRVPFSLDAHYGIRPFYWDWFYEHQDWKAAQKEAFATLVFELRRAFRAGIRRTLEVWSLLPLLQKFLIIAPAVLFYIYCDVIPAARKIRRIYQRWRRRRQEM